MTISLKTIAPSLGSGVLLAWCFPTWHLYPLAWVALVPLFLACEGERPATAAKQFFVAGFVFNLLLLQWLITNIYWAGGWAIVGYAFLCAILALFWCLTGFLWVWSRKPLPDWLSPVLLAALWVAMEYGQANLFTGFGWGSLGYSQGRDMPLLQLASVGGGTLISAMLVFVNVLIAKAGFSPWSRLLPGAIAVAVVLAAHGLGAVLVDEPDYQSKPMRVGILQANFPLEMKWDWEYTEDMVRSAAEKSSRLAAAESVNLIVWPESLLMDDFRSPALQPIIATLAKDTGVWLFAGAERVDDTTHSSRNSSVLVNPSGEIVDYYDKIHLAPFGEYVPLSEYLPFVQKIVPAIGNIEAGKEPRVIHVGDRRFGPLICFEVLFGGMAERLRTMGADALVVVTNLGWFGRSNAIPQELEIARLRAVEMRLPLVHASNTGISGVFDPWGRFSIVNAAYNGRGDYMRLLDGSYEASQTTMQRMGGAFALSANAERPIPYGPTVFPWLAITVGGALVLWAVLQSRRGAPSPLAAELR